LLILTLIIFLNKTDQLTLQGRASDRNVVWEYEENPEICALQEKGVLLHLMFCPDMYVLHKEGFCMV